LPSAPFGVIHFFIVAYLPPFVNRFPLPAVKKTAKTWRKKRRRAGAKRREKDGRREGTEAESRGRRGDKNGRGHRSRTKTEGEKRGKRSGRTKEAVGKRKAKRRHAATVLPEGEREEKKTASVLTRDEKCGIIQSNSVNVKF
jgi:hypothetical protein